MRSTSLSRIVLFGILSLFFLQLISDFVESLYVFGLMGGEIPPEIVAVLLLLSPVLLLILGDLLSGWPQVLVGVLMLLSRVIEPLLETRGRMLTSGFGVACFLLLLPTLISGPDRRRTGFHGMELGAGLTLGLTLSILFRTLNSGRDFSTYGMFQILGWGLAILAALLLLGLRKSTATVSETWADEASEPRPRWWRTAGLALGTISVLILLYLSFSSPTVIARWTGASYPLVLITILFALSIFAILSHYRPGFLAAPTPGFLLAWNLIFVISLVLTILLHQTRFPAQPGAYPFLMPATNVLHRLLLLLTLLSFPVILVDFALFAEALAASRPRSRGLGSAFTLASFVFLLVLFAHIFTTVYDYIPVVGPFFREKFWLAYLVPSITLLLPFFLVYRVSQMLDLKSLEESVRRPLYPGAVVLLALVSIAGLFLVSARPAASPESQQQVKVLTYNILQGFNAEGQENNDGQLKLLRQADADIIGLQETDTARLAGGNTDVVRFLADRLDYYSYYGPRSVDGTFGVALLSRYPIKNPTTMYHYSEHEQEATIHAQIAVGDKIFEVYITHLASEDAEENLNQQKELLSAIGDRENVILMGDFNFSTDSPEGQYVLTTAVLDDSWTLVWPQVEKRAADPTEKAIDHIFVSPGTTVTDAAFVHGSEAESDHPAVSATVAW
jgi:endonuclease/exonuclease/phosphatase family metal-dependent hydrolase